MKYLQVVLFAAVVLAVNGGPPGQYTGLQQVARAMCDLDFQCEYGCECRSPALYVPKMCFCRNPENPSGQIMSHSPSYSPVLDIVNPLNLQNVIDDTDPVTNPFFYAQDRESWDMEVAAKAYEESRINKQKEQTLKKKNKSKSLENTSYIIKRDTGRVRRIVKIIIHDLDVNDNSEINCSDPNSASVNVQYLVRNDYDDVMEETEHLVGKIVKKLSAPDSL